MLHDDLITAFHKTQSFKWDPKGGFKLASGLLSPFYVDCRTLMAFPHARHLVAKRAWEVIKDFQVFQEALVGVVLVHLHPVEQCLVGWEI